MNPLLTLEDLPLGQLAGVIVLARVDFNVPLDDGKVGDTARLEAALPTLADLRRAGARTLVVSHCGRPDGEVDPAYSLRPVAAELERLLGSAVAFADDCVGPTAATAAAELAPGGVALLENLRFHPGETANDPDFAGRLAALASVYVGDAFGAAHRAHASTVGVAVRLARHAAGRLMVSEVTALEELLTAPARPFVAVLGGAKIAGKADTLRNLLPRVDRVVLGGAMANTFLAAQGLELGRSLVERDRLELAREILAAAAERGVTFVLPADLVVTDDLASPGRIEVVPAATVPPATLAVDIGPQTRAAIADALAGAGTVFWNGPMGVFEQPPFDDGTNAVARAVAGCGARTVIGGGETLAAARRAGVERRIGHVSTGGGASLELLAGRRLPGVEVLRRGS